VRRPAGHRGERRIAERRWHTPRGGEPRPGACGRQLPAIPLATSSSSPADYDLVIHGPGIATIIIKAVQVPLASSTSTATTTTAASATTIHSVSVGTLIPRAASSYTANLGSATGAKLPAGAQVAFYQNAADGRRSSLRDRSEPIDPFNQVLANAQALSEGTVDSGTYSASGAAVTLVSAAPAKAPGGTWSRRARPRSPTEPSRPPCPRRLRAQRRHRGRPYRVLTLAPGITSGSISASVTQATTGKYDHGELLVTHDGMLVATAPLDAALARGAGASITVNGLPSGTSAARYYVAVRAWNSRDATGTLQRQSYPTAIDLRGSATGAVQLDDQLKSTRKPVN